MKIIYFDTETTGLKNKDRVIQFSAIVVEDGKVVKMINEYCDTSINIPQEAIRVHGIDNLKLKELSKGQSLGEVFIKHNLYDGNKLWVAHNCSFDKRMINNTLESLGYPKVNFGLTVMQPELVNDKSVYNICTMKMFKNKGKYVKLVELIKKLNKTISEDFINKRFELMCKSTNISFGRTMAHDALYDSFLVMIVYTLRKSLE